MNFMVTIFIKCLYRYSAMLLVSEHPEDVGRILRTHAAAIPLHPDPTTAIFMRE